MPSPDPLSENIARAETLPAHWYHDPQIFLAEREAIFKKEWLILTSAKQLEEELPDPGSYVLKNYAGMDFFIRRGKDGTLHAFHNVCRHRAGPLFCNKAGTSTNIRCQYHNWTYGDDGQLQKMPGFGDATHFNKKDYPLSRVRMETWQGLVFINFDEKAAPLSVALHELNNILQNVDMAGFLPYQELTHDIDCNWKTYVENYLEGYHISAVHPGLNRVTDMDSYRVQPGERVIITVNSMRDNADSAAAGIWPWIFPNATLNIYEGGDCMNIEIYVPLGPEKIQMRQLYFFKDISPEKQAQHEKTLMESAQITREDMDICNRVQKNLKSGIYQTGRFSPRHENGVYQFQCMVRKAVEKHRNLLPVTLAPTTQRTACTG